MKFLFNKKDQSKFLKLFDVKEINMSVADINISTFDDGAFIQKEELEKIKQERNISQDQAIYELMMEYHHIDLDESENIEIGEKYFLNNIKECNIDKYIANPYNFNVKPSEFKLNKLSLLYLKYRPYQLFSLDEIKVDNNYYEEYSPIGYFDKEYDFLALLQDDVIWMSITPNEINSMQNIINLMSGEILVLGLGLGYFPYMCSIKEEVKKIVVVENNKEIIKIFNDKILPFFKYKNKIQIVEMDAYEYLKRGKKNRFDYVFVDIYHNANEGLNLYVKCLPYEEQYKAQFFYWLEPSILSLGRRCLLTLFYEQYNHLNIKYNKANNDIDLIINKMYYLLKNKTYYSFDKIHSSLSEKNIKNLLKEITLKI